MKVELHIERLVLEGVDPGDGRKVGAALERELGRLVAARGLPPALQAGGDRSRIDAGRLDGSSRTAGAETGRRIARSVYRGMGS